MKDNPVLQPLPAGASNSAGAEAASPEGGASGLGSAAPAETGEKQEGSEQETGEKQEKRKESERYARPRPPADDVSSARFKLSVVGFAVEHADIEAGRLRPCWVWKRRSDTRPPRRLE